MPSLLEAAEEYELVKKHLGNRLADELADLRKQLAERDAELSAWRRWAGKYAGAPVPDETLRANVGACAEPEGDLSAYSGGILSDVCDIAFRDEDRAMLKGYEGIKERVRALVETEQRFQGRVSELRGELSERDAELQHLRSQAGPDSDADVIVRLRQERDELRSAVIRWAERADRADRELTEYVEANGLRTEIRRRRKVEERAERAEAELSAWHKWAGRFAGAPVATERLRANAEAYMTELHERADRAEAELSRLKDALRKCFPSALGREPPRDPLPEPLKTAREALAAHESAAVATDRAEKSAERKEDR